MDNRKNSSEASELFVNTDPETVWNQAMALIGRITPTYDFALVHAVFDDVVNLFRGKFPGYGAIKTPYHNLPHTLDVFLCAVRLIHGMQLAGAGLSDREISLVMIATLLHDVGYAQMRDGNETGTGAQYTPIHVSRGIDFMRAYFARRNLPRDFPDDLAPVISCSDPRLSISRIVFPSERIRIAGQIVGTADLVGQMADRNYLEKLVFLFQEFEEARMGDYKSVHDMMRKTEGFYATIQKKLDEDFGGLYHKLALHFQDTLGVNQNLYMESIRSNMDYLSRVTALSESEYLAQLRRGGIIRNFQSGNNH